MVQRRELALPGLRNLTDGLKYPKSDEDLYRDRRWALMGTIETQIDLERDLTIHTASGEISADEILRRIRSYYEGEVTRLLMWDLSDADLRSLSASDVQNMVDLTNSLTAPRAGREDRAGCLNDARLRYGPNVRAVQRCLRRRNRSQDVSRQGSGPGMAGGSAARL